MTKIIMLNVSGDTDVEAGKGFTVALFNPTNSNVTTPTANVT